MLFSDAKKNNKFDLDRENMVIGPIKLQKSVIAYCATILDPIDLIPYFSNDKIDES